MKSIYYFLIVVLCFTACGVDNQTKIHGNGILDSKEIQASSFSEVESSGQYNLFFLQDSTFDIRIEAESNIIPLIDVYVVNNKLTVENDDKYRFDLNEPIKIFIHHAGVVDIDYRGAGNIDLDEMVVESNFKNSISGTGDLKGSIEANNVDFSISGDGSIDASLNCYNVDASISGTGNINLRGNAQDGIFSISGVGNIRAYDLPLKNCYTKISGAGDNYFSVSNYLNVTISGVGNIYYKGNPDIDQQITGVGSVKKMD